MRKIILPFIIFSFMLSLVLLGDNKKNNAGLLSSSAIINSLDTVVFDLSGAIVNGSVIDIPVFILSNDTINALDFSLKYNHAVLQYDTILDLTTYISPFSYYNSSDSTIRFTSNSFTRYTNGVPLVHIRFNIIGTQVTANDLNTLKGYLNGTTCSVKLVGAVINVGISVSTKYAEKIFPNPANDFIVVDLNRNANIELVNAEGKSVKFCSHETKKIEVANLPSGIYFLNILYDNYKSTQKVIIQH